MAKKTIPTGKELEQRVAEYYRALGARKVEHDVELAGHQIDVYVEFETPDRSLLRIAVEAKNLASKKVGIRIVEGFLAVVDHLWREGLIDRGVIVSVTGFSRPARNAAQTATAPIRLLDPNDLRAAMYARGSPERLLVSVSELQVSVNELQGILTRRVAARSVSEEKHLVSENGSSFTSLLHNRLVIDYLREATRVGLDMEQLPESNLGAILERVVRQIIEGYRFRLLSEYEQMPSAEESCRLFSYLGWYMFSEGITVCGAKDATVVVKEAMNELHMDQYSDKQVLDWLTTMYWLRKTRGNAFEFRDTYIVNVFAAMELKQWFFKGLGSVFLLGRTGDPGHKLADEPAKWQQVIVPLAGMLPQDQAVELLEVLLEEQLIQLAGWCIAEGQPMPQHIVARVIHELMALLAGGGPQ